VKRVLLAFTLLLAGCSFEPAPVSAPVSADFRGCGAQHVDLGALDVNPLDGKPQAQLPVTVTSADGRTVTITDTSRILAVDLYGSLAEIVFALGLGGQVIGRDTATSFAAAQHLPLVTPAGHDLSAEGIIRLNPTVILTDTSIGPAVVLEQLRAMGIPVVFVDPKRTLETVPERITTVASALGVPQAGDQLAQRFLGELKEALPGTREGSPVVAFLYLRGSAGVYLIGGDGAGSDAMIEAAGGVDAGTQLGLQNFRPLTSEGLVTAAPDILLVMTKGLESVGGAEELLVMPGIAQTPAAQAKRVIDIEDSLLLNFGTRTPQVVKALADAVWCQ
jgi:iron complex transport system substrate-binding protein